MHQARREAVSSSYAEQERLHDKRVAEIRLAGLRQRAGYAETRLRKAEVMLDEQRQRLDTQAQDLAGKDERIKQLTETIRRQEWELGQLARQKARSDR